MKTVKMLALTAGMVFVWVMASGCVSRDEYLREKFGRRKAIERAEILERDLADCQSRSLSLEQERESLHRELDTKTAMAETLKAENSRLEEFAMKLQAQMDDVLAKGIGDIEVVEIKLPPELDQALQDFAAQYPDTIEYDPQRGAVRWKSDLTFALGSDVVKQTVKASLKAFADIVNAPAAKPFEVVVVGHTDNVRIGSATQKKHPTNWHLSTHRAVSVMFALNQFGIGFDRMGVMGYGEFRPRVENPARGGAEANRRVEIFLVASGDQAATIETATKVFGGSPGVAKAESE